MTERADLQLNIFGGEVPMEKVVVEPGPAVCTRDEGCQADVADHFEDCPVEQQLRETFGF